MNRITLASRFLPLLVLAAVLTSAPAAWADEPADDPIAALKAEVQTLRKQVADLQAENAQLKAQLSAQTTPTPAPGAAPTTPAAEKLVTLEAENQALKQELDEARSTTQSLETEKQQLEKLAGVSAKGELVESQIALVDTVYDPSADRTTVTVKPKFVRSPSITGFVEHRLGVSTRFTGQTPRQAPDKADIEFFTVSNPGRGYKSAKTITLIADGNPIELRITDYEVLEKFAPSKGLGRTTSSGVESRDEKITAAIDWSAVPTLAAASTLKLKIINIELDLSREHIAMFGALRQRIDLMQSAPATPDTPDTPATPGHSG